MSPASNPRVKLRATNQGVRKSRLGSPGPSITVQVIVATSYLTFSIVEVYKASTITVYDTDSYMARIQPVSLILFNTML